MRFSRQEYCSRLPFPPPKDLHDPGIKPTSPVAPELQEDSSPLSHQGSSYAEYIIRNARLDEAQVGIMIAKRNINNLRYADDTTLMAENKEGLKSLLIKVKEESEKAGLKLNIQKN